MLRSGNRQEHDCTIRPPNLQGREAAGQWMRAAIAVIRVQAAGRREGGRGWINEEKFGKVLTGVMKQIT